MDKSVQFACMPADFDFIYVPIHELVTEFNPADELYYQKTKLLSQSELRQRVIFKRGKRPKVRYIRGKGAFKFDRHNPELKFSSQE